jgi:hypothetical protein
MKAALNVPIGDRWLSAWQVAPGVTWVQTRLPLYRLPRFAKLVPVVVPPLAPKDCANMAQTTVPVYLTAKLGSLACTKYRQGTAVRTKVKPKMRSAYSNTRAFGRN